MNLAVIDSNRLSCMGLQNLLQDIIPLSTISVFCSFEAFVMSRPERFAHCFVSSGLYFEHAAYFQSLSHHCIVLVQGDNFPRMAGLLTINVCQDESHLVKDLLRLRRQGHEGRAALMPPPAQLLSSREQEVAVLLAKGLINKEVASRLNISPTTVITHRKNIMEKLHARSLADIIIYVVTQGLVPLEELS